MILRVRGLFACSLGASFRAVQQLLVGKGELRAHRSQEPAEDLIHPTQPCAIFRIPIHRRTLPLL